MIIVQSFEKAPIENMISALACKPEKVIFLGEISQMKKSAAIFERILKEKEIHTEILLKGIRKNDLNNILQTVTEIVETETEIIFDVTGGEKLVLLAFGMIYERYKVEKNLKLQRFNINTGKIIDCDCDNETTFEGEFSLDVKELISMYGGIVVPEEPQPMIENALEVVDKVWDLARVNGAKWNRSHSYLKELERKGDRSEEELEIKADFREIKDSIGDYLKKYRDVISFLEKLQEAHLICDLQISEDKFSYRYCSAFARRCLINAGDALEMKAYCEALAMQKKGRPYFNDCYVGVTIDWDGVIHPKDENWKDTTNEIDLILMRGLTPYFVSCKNGKIGEEELYKLHTVAERFGGKYAKKMLIATKLERDSYAAKKAYMQRAEDMGIVIIPNAGEMTKEEWKKVFIS